MNLEVKLIPTKYTSVTLDKDFLKLIDEKIKGKYRSRADFFREAARNQLRKINTEGI